MWSFVGINGRILTRGKPHGSAGYLKCSGGDGGPSCYLGGLLLTDWVGTGPDPIMCGLVEWAEWDRRRGKCLTQYIMVNVKLQIFH